MSSKKIIAALLAIAVVASTTIIFNQINIKGVFAETIKQNVLYTKENASTVSKVEDTGKISDSENEAYKKKSLEVLNKYFNISAEENEDFKFDACILNLKTLNEIELEEIKATQNEYDNKGISKEEYDKQINFIKKNDGGLKERVEKLKHGMVQATWAGVEDDRVYLIDFNENTKEVDYVLVSEESPTKSDVPLTISEEQLKSTAENFIKKNKLANIENPKFIFSKGTRAFFEDENDPSKKVHVGVDRFTGKVSNFSVNAYAELEYANAINKE